MTEGLCRVELRINGMRYTCRGQDPHGGPHWINLTFGGSTMQINWFTEHRTTPSQPWRVGEHYGIHVYEGDEPVATFFRADDARIAVSAVDALMTKESDDHV